MNRLQDGLHSMNDTSGNCILFFVKDPVEGAVKSRLAAELGEKITLEIYRNFILDMLATLDRCDADCLICVYPGYALNKIKQWLGIKYQYLPQEGENLGARMKNSFINAFGMRYAQAILLGSDIPDLPLDIINRALQIRGTNDVTIGPARDGGYYLIGFQKETFIPEVFDHMHWSGTTVLRDTLHRVIQSGLRVHLLPAWSDVDTLEDLLALLHRNSSGRGSCPKTMACLDTLAGCCKIPI